MKTDSTMTKLMTMKIKPLSIVAFSCLVLAACGGGSDNGAPSGDAAGGESGLSDFEMEHGIGPVTERVNIPDEIDSDMVDQGRSIYQRNCEACHTMESRMVGPELGDIVEVRSPEFIMNFILNPSGMINEHPVGQALLEEYMTPMPYQNVSEDEARAIFEYLRYYAENN